MLSTEAIPQQSQLCCPPLVFLKALVLCGMEGLQATGYGPLVLYTTSPHDPVVCSRWSVARELPDAALNAERADPFRQ